MNKKMILTAFALTATFSAAAHATSTRELVVKLDDVSCIGTSIDRSNCASDVDQAKLDFAVKATCSESFEAILKDGSHVSRAASAIVQSDRIMFRHLILHKVDIAAHKRAYERAAADGLGRINDQINKMPKCVAANPAPAPDVIDPAPAGGELPPAPAAVPAPSGAAGAAK